MDVFIVGRGGVDIAAIYLEDQPDGVFIESLELLPEYQHQGAGSAALDWIGCRIESEGGVVSLKVHKANIGARRLYERCGFSIVDQTQTHYLMRSPAAAEPDRSAGTA